MPWVGVAGAAEEVEPRAQLFEQGLRGEQLGASGRELEGERQAVEPVTEHVDRGRAVHIRSDRARANEE